MKGLYAWDIAGGLTLVRGSDGLASDFHGNAFINRKSTLVASNSYIHNSLLEKLDNL